MCRLIDLWIQAWIRTDEQRSVIANGVDHMPTVTFQHADKHVEADVGERMYDVAERAEGGIPFACKAGACGICATRVLEGMNSLGRVSAREARTLTNLDLNPEIFRLTCLANVGRGDIVWGQPNSAPEANQTLGTYGVRVESYRPLNLTVAEVRFYVQAEDFSFTPGQYMIFHIPDAPHVVRRSYSISTPHRTPGTSKSVYEPYQVATAPTISIGCARGMSCRSRGLSVSSCSTSIRSATSS